MDANHFDAVAAKHGDPHTRFMDNAVDDADDEADGSPVSFPVVVPPSKRSRRVRLYLTEDEYAALTAKAMSEGVPVSYLLRTTLVEMIGGWHGLDRRAGNAPAAADAQGVPGGRGETESVDQDEGA